ncbi:IS4 orf [Shigella flexneri]|nr:IS4 orf [Shigella flexneri]
MHIGQALDLVSRYDSLRNPLTSLGDYLDPELISRCLAESGTVMKWHTEFGHLNRGDMLTSEQHRCSNEKKKF